MGRDRRDFGNKRGFQKRHHNHHPDRSWQTEKRLLETEVGIDKNINDLAGFNGVIKSRFSDFHVNEIDLQKQQAVFSEISLPQLADFETPEEKSSAELLNLEDFIDAEKRKEIDDLVSGEDYHKSVLIEVTEMDKDQRGNLHKALRKEFSGKTSNDTITTGTDKKYIQIKKFGRNAQKDQMRGWQWPGEFVYFILFKENIDTLQAISLLAKNLKLKASLFNYCGTKDKRAKTSQWISVKKVDPSKIVQAARRLQGIRVGNFKFGKTPFKLGELSGNRFQIALRSVDAEEQVINEACDGVKENGFLNYFGLQRFGNCAAVPTHEIGKALLKSDYKLAVELILKERDGEPKFMKSMRESWAKTQDASEALKFVDHRQANFVEFKVLQSLAKNSNNYLQALQSLPRNMLMLYMHAYQSLIFNQAASKRRELGLGVIEGDLVFKESVDVPPESDIICEATEDADANEGEDDIINEEEETEKKSKYIDMVKALTKEEVESGSYTIFDIVLVLPGHDIQFPSGAIGDYYLELLRNDDLSPETFKHSQKSLSLGGSYRKVFIKPADMQWKILKYENPTDELILSDYSRIMKDREIESKPDAKNRALILDFTLPQSCYATMLLRELLKKDSSAQTQMQLQKELETQRDEKNGAEKRKLEEHNDDEPQEKAPKIE